MKKSLLLLAALAFAATSFAQSQPGISQATALPTTHLPTHRGQRVGDGQKAAQGKTPEQRADKHLAMLTKSLNLTAAQQPKVRQLLLTQAQENQALKTQYPADNQRQARHQAMKAAKANYQTQLQAVLNPDQYSKLVAMKKEHHKGGKHDQSKKS